MGLLAPWHLGSSWTRDQTGISFIGRQILNQWNAREAWHQCCLEDCFTTNSKGYSQDRLREPRENLLHRAELRERFSDTGTSTETLFSLFPAEQKLVCVCVCVCVVKGSNERTHPQGAGQNPEGWGMEEETTKPLHLQKEQGYILGSEILTKPHPWDSWTPGPTNTEAYSENTHPCYSPRNIN